MAPRARSRLVLLALLCGPAAVRGQGITKVVRVKLAEAALKAGHFTEAEQQFTSLLQQLSTSESALRAGASFGRAVAIQQRASAGGDTSAGAPLERALADYLMARTLDTAMFFGPASNNAGLILRGRGQHYEAWKLFQDAAASRHAARPYFLYNVGLECEALSERDPRWFDSATTAYRSAIAVNPSYVEARQALLGVYIRRGLAVTVLALAREWSAQGGDLGPVNDALLGLLGRPEPSAGQQEEALLQLVGNYAAIGLDPDYFAVSQRTALAAVAKAQPWLRYAVSAVLDAYRTRPAGSVYREPADAGWWRLDPERRRVWSSVLRSLGDYYNRLGDDAAAASFYEAAIGWPNTSLYERWVDLDAMLPLAVIYAHRASSAPQSDSLSSLIEAYTGLLFRAKAASYAASDIRRERSFHMTLGALFAERAQWGQGPTDVRGAVFQLEHMRQLSSFLSQQTGRPVSDPPELLEQLVRGYRAQGRRIDADRVACEVRDAYGRLGRGQDRARADSLIADRRACVPDR